MTGQDFIDQFRVIRDDRVKPYLWSDDEVLAYLTEGELEAAVRAKLIEDSTTPSCCLLPFGTDAEYALDPAVLLIKRATYLGKPLTETSVDEQDGRDSNWEARTGEPSSFIQREGFIRLVPKPATAGELALTVYRTPLEPIGLKTEPEIAARFHFRLLAWVHRCAMLKQDAETFDAAAAKRYEAEFTESFGERQDANVQRKRRDRRPPVTRIAW